METATLSLVGPEDLIEDLMAQMQEPNSGAVSVQGRQPPETERGGAAADPFTIAVGAATIVLATVEIAKATNALG